MSYSSNDILGFDFVRKTVGNARNSAFSYAALQGYTIIGYQGPESGVRDQVSYLLKQGEILMAVTAPIVPDHRDQEFLRRHGDNIHEFSFRVRDVDTAYAHALARGAQSVEVPTHVCDGSGTLRRASLALYGDTVLTLLDRSAYQGHFPGYVPYEGFQPSRGRDCGLRRIDHIVGNVEAGRMNEWAAWFEDKLDLETFIHFDQGDISTRFSSLLSKVVRSRNGRVRLPINEPAKGLKKSQIEEFLDVHYGPGVQHIALETDDILATIPAMRERGCDFIPTPHSYYQVIEQRAQGIAEPLAELERCDILLDRDENGYLLQLFTQPVGDRPTLFYEIIQRRGCDGFGQNNFQALFEAIEREQAKRGNL